MEPKTYKEEVETIGDGYSINGSVLKGKYMIKQDNKIPRRSKLPYVQSNYGL